MSKTEDDIAVGTWLTHRTECAKCREVNHHHPKTVANVCLRGAPLFKAYVEIQMRPEVRRRAREESAVLKQARGEFYTTKAKSRAQARYTGGSKWGDA